MLNIKRYALIGTVALMLTSSTCYVTAFAEGLTEMTDIAMDDTGTGTGLNGLEANDYTPGTDEQHKKEKEQIDAESGDTSENHDNLHPVDTGNAVDDILNNQRYAGAMRSITKVTDFVDKWFIVVISVVAFFIISAAMLKNVMAGAYVANPKFWDLVHEAHNKMMQYSISSLRGIKVDQITATSVRDIFLGIIPDVKGFTDFEDSSAADIDPKKYFSKSIPQMLLCVIIGIFIYNGYYRDTASKVGAFGAESFERFIGQADPVALADRLYNTTGKPKTKYDTSKTISAKLGKDISDKIYNLYISKYTDINGPGTKSALMAAIVKDTDSYLESCKAWLVEDNKSATGFKYRYNVVVNASTDSPTSFNSKSYNNGRRIETYKIINVYSEGDLGGTHYSDINGREIGMTSIIISVNFDENLDMLSDNADGTLAITMGPNCNKKELNDALNAAGYAAVNLATEATLTPQTVQGQITEKDGKRYQLVPTAGDKTSIGEATLKDN